MADITVAPAGGVGMITLRGELSVLAKAAGMGVPAQRMSVTSEGCRLNWMSPDELLLVCPHAEVGDRAAALTKALEGAFATVADVSDARAVFDLTGSLSEVALAHLVPVDFARMAPTEVRRTRMAQVPAALWREGAGWRVVCFRSVADYVHALLADAAISARA